MKKPGLLSRIFGRNEAPAPEARPRPGLNTNKHPESGAFLGGLGHAANGYYEALRPSDDRTRMLVNRFLGPSESARQHLSLLARAVYDNDGRASYAVDTISLYSAPVTVKAASPDEAWNDEADAWWSDWCKRCDFKGRPEVGFASLQKEACAALDLDGDRGSVFTDEAGFPQIQLIDGHRISTPDKHPEADSVDSGVGLSKSGRVVGYYVERDDGKHDFFAAGTFFLLRDVSAVNPLRGLSPMRRGLNDLRDVRDIVAFEKNVAKLLGTMPGVIKGGVSDEADQFDTGKDEDGNDDPNAPAPAEEMPKGIKRMDLTGSDIPVMEEGQEFQQVESNRPNAQFGDFMDFLVGAFVAGLGLPPAFHLDAKNTGPGWRAVIGKAQRKFDERQAIMGAWAEWAWVRAIGWAIANKQLRSIPNWMRVSIQRPARITIDLGDEAAADREAVKAGYMTRAEYAAKRQRDYQDDMKQSVKEDGELIELLRELSKKTGVPPEVLLARHGFEPPTKPKEPPPK